MNNTDNHTMQKILLAAEKEFLDKGFKSASLRNIVKNAGVTTGAFYGYFDTKEKLFSSLVKECADNVMRKFIKSQEDFERLPESSQPENMGNGSYLFLCWLLDYIYDNYNSFKLLICKADGTEYENFVHNMVEIEVEQTMKFISVLHSLGHDFSQIDRELCHIISSGMFGAMFEILVHDMPKYKAELYIKQLCLFHTAGWEKLMGL